LYKIEPDPLAIPKIGGVFVNLNKEKVTNSVSLSPITITKSI